jgi:hypothetical protein
MSRLAQIVASSEGLPLYIERNGEPFRAAYIPISSARDAYLPSCPGVPAAAEPVPVALSRSARGLSSMEA